MHSSCCCWRKRGQRTQIPRSRWWCNRRRAKPWRKLNAQGRSVPRSRPSSSSMTLVCRVVLRINSGLNANLTRYGIRLLLGIVDVVYWCLCCIVYINSTPTGTAAATWRQVFRLKREPRTGKALGKCFVINELETLRVTYVFAFLFVHRRARCLLYLGLGFGPGKNWVVLASIAPCLAYQNRHYSTCVFNTGQLGRFFGTKVFSQTNRHNTSNIFCSKYSYYLLGAH